MQNRSLYLVAYDITDNQRRSAMLKRCRAYATGGQKSVHECWLSDAELSDLLQDAELLLDLTCDSVMAISLDGRIPVRTLGQGVEPLHPDFLMVV